MTIASIFISVALLPLLAGAPARKAATPAFAGVWVGAALDAEAEVVRLELDGQGKGVLIISESPGSPPDAYYVRATLFKEPEISFTLEPIGGSQPISVRGRFTFHMSLLITSEDDEWSRKVNLRESTWLTTRLRDAEHWAGEVRQKGAAALQSR